MGITAGRSRWLSGGAALVSIMVAACGSSTTSAPSSGAGMEHEAMSPGAMMIQPGAELMKATIASPADGTVVTGIDLGLSVTTSGYEDTCDLAGKANQKGTGHYHVLIDRSLVNMFCTPHVNLSMQNLKPGRHTIAAVPAQNDHGEVEKNESSITIDYEPAAAPAPVLGSPSAQAPKIKIVSPAPGSVVGGAFDVTVEIANFDDSCALFGKPDVAGHGHWHLNVDSTTEGMMGMGTMLGMSCTPTIHVSTRGLKPGSSHDLIALLVDNGHAPLKPEVSSRVPITVAG